VHRSFIGSGGQWDANFDCSDRSAGGEVQLEDGGVSGEGRGVVEQNGGDLRSEDPGELAQHEGALLAVRSPALWKVLAEDDDLPRDVTLGFPHRERVVLKEPAVFARIQPRTQS
jgi:hypothetical protein